MWVCLVWSCAHRQSELPGLSDAIRVHVEGLVTDEPRGEQLADRLANPAEAADQHILALQK